jgi:uncharacterized protein (DUF1330 family)
MKKGYWIVNVEVLDQARYPDYVAANKLAFDKFGARFLVRGGAYEVVNGQSRPRQVVIESESFDTAKACFRLPEYQAALRIFETCARSDVVIAEGV